MVQLASAPQTGSPLEDSSTPSYQHIVVPTGLASADQAALRLGLELAGQHGARLTLLHVVQRPEPRENNPAHWLDALDGLYDSLSQSGTLEQALRDGHAALAKFVEQAMPATQLRAVNPRLDCRVGEVAPQIAKVANAGQADLLLLTYEPKRWRLPLWPRMYRAVSSLTCTPILLVPAAAAPLPARPLANGIAR